MALSLLPLIPSGPAEAAAASPVKWLKYVNNPVMGCGSAGTWDRGQNLFPGSVIQDGAGLKMYYTGMDGTSMRIGLATSLDGIIWTKHASNPLIGLGTSGSWESSHVYGPCVMKDGSVYKMWYIGTNGSNNRIGYATSTDGISWTKYAGNPVFDHGGTGAWDRGDVGYPTVLNETGVFKMWYSGGASVYAWSIGYATSTDGINWTKYAGNPVLVPGASWDSAQTTTQKVLNVSGEYRMWYGGHNGDSKWKIGYANSTDGTSWKKYAYNPVLSNVAAWEATCVFMPAVIFNGSAYRMWYTGMSAPGVMGIGYAEGWNTVPNAPSLLAPPSNIWTTNNRPIFSWTFRDPDPNDFQTAYQVQLDNDSAFGSVDHDSGKVYSAATSYTPAGGIADGIYYWRARVWDSDNYNSAWNTSRMIKIDTVPPLNPGTFSSTSHLTGIWSNDSTIDITFSGASDATSGLDGFSIVWDYACSTMPDATLEIEGTESAMTSPAMLEGDSIYFHIRSVDSAGNWNDTAAHLGPFQIDSTPPRNPSDLSCPDLLPQHWTNNATITMVWNDADASISGAGGYSFLWDRNPFTVPGTIINATGDVHSAPSPLLSDGNNWYFHLRSKDNAGNWAQTAVHRGP